MTIRIGIVLIHAPTKGMTRVCKFNVAQIVVSIHAPTKGATKQNGLFSFLHGVSIHAPTKGATYCQKRLQNIRLGFNPRTNKGCDKEKVEELKDKIVSIHAPTKGATFNAYEAI